MVSGPGQVWQSDITYIRVGARFCYLTFIIDVYTRRIVGYAASRDLRALRGALGRLGGDALAGCTHHSDRGSQYTDGRYVGLLRAAGMAISMGRTATDNAFAERINGVVKNEYLIPWAPANFGQLNRYCKKAVTDYNTKRHYGALPRPRCSPREYEARCEQLSAGQRRVEIIRSEHTLKNLEGTLQGGTVDTTIEYPYCTLNLT